MAKPMGRANKNIILMISIVFGLLGAFMMGSFGTLFYQRTDNFTEEQRQYIFGVYVGSAYAQDRVNAEKSGQKQVDDNYVLVLNPHDRCVRRFYPKDQLSLAGCLDAVDMNGWNMP